MNATTTRIKNISTGPTAHIMHYSTAARMARITARLPHHSETPVPRASGTAALRSKIPLVEKETRPATGGPQEGAERPWWRMVLGG
jgi:hypothetical protein